MAKTLLTTLSALALTTALGAQPQTPATQPVRPPDRPTTGGKTTPLPAPEPDLGSDRARGLGDRAGADESTDPEAGTLTLQGCLQRVRDRTFRLHPVEGNDATVTEDVRLGGDLTQLRDHVGRVVEVRGRYEQATPAATTPATFSVDRVKALTATCPAR